MKITMEKEERIPAVFIIGVILALILAGFSDFDSISGQAVRRTRTPTAASQIPLTVEIQGTTAAGSIVPTLAKSRNYWIGESFAMKISAPGTYQIAQVPTFSSAGYYLNQVMSHTETAFVSAVFVSNDGKVYVGQKDPTKVTISLSQPFADVEKTYTYKFVAFYQDEKGNLYPANVVQGTVFPALDLPGTNFFETLYRGNRDAYNGWDAYKREKILDGEKKIIAPSLPFYGKLTFSNIPTKKGTTAAVLQAAFPAQQEEGTWKIILADRARTKPYYLSQGGYVIKDLQFVPGFTVAEQPVIREKIGKLPNGKQSVLKIAGLAFKDDRKQPLRQSTLGSLPQLQTPDKNNYLFVNLISMRGALSEEKNDRYSLKLSGEKVSFVGKSGTSQIVYIPIPISSSVVSGAGTRIQKNIIIKSYPSSSSCPETTRGKVTIHLLFKDKAGAQHVLQEYIQEVYSQSAGVC